MMSGLPVHLWGRTTFETIGDLCGGLVDFEIQDPGSLEWVSLRVNRPKNVRQVLWVEDGMLAYKVQPWRYFLQQGMSLMALDHKLDRWRRKGKTKKVITEGEGALGRREYRRNSNLESYATYEEMSDGDRGCKSDASSGKGGR